MTNKNLWWVIVALVVAGGILYLIPSRPHGPTDYKNATYIINGEAVTLLNGMAETEAAPGSASKTITKYFGNDVKTDLNADGIPDLAFLLTQESGGSGTFFYLVGAVQHEDNSYTGTDAVFLGDRIAPQTTEVSRNPDHKGVIIVNYAERKQGDPMTAQPSVGKSTWLKLDPATLTWGEVAADFEGEADPARMTLNMKTWNWISTSYKDGRVFAPKASGVFTLTFNTDRVSIGTDCNSAGASYSADDAKTISFGPIAATKKYCANSQEGDFFGMLGNSASYHFTSKGELVLELKSGSGSMVLR